MHLEKTDIIFNTFEDWVKSIAPDSVKFIKFINIYKGESYV